MLDPHEHLRKSSVGLKTRLAALKMALSGKEGIYTAVRKRDSIALSSIVLNFTARPETITDDHKAILRYVNFSFSYRNYADKIEFTNIIKDQKRRALLRYIAVGDGFLIGQESTSYKLSPADYSLLCRQGNDSLDDKEVEKQRTCFVRFFHSQKLNYGDVKSVIRSYSLLKPNSRNAVNSIKISCISDIQEHMRFFSGRLWPITGSYVPHTIYRLCDPEEKFEVETYRKLRSECRSVLLEPIYNFLLVLRAINGYEDALSFIDKEDLLQIISANRYLREKFSLYFRGHYVAAANFDYTGRIFTNKILSITITIYALIEMGGSLSRLYREIANLYEVDKQAVMFLDWGRITSYASKFNPGYSSLAILFSILLTEAPVSRRFPIEIGLGLGQGRVNRQIFDRANDLFRTGKAKKISQFMQSFLDLKGECRCYVFTYLADRAISDRLYAVFTSSLKKDQNYDERRVSQTRIDILNFVCDHQSGDITNLLKFKDEETNLLRGLHFKEVYTKGRVHLDLLSLQLELELIIYDEFNVGNIIDRKQVFQSDYKFLGHFTNVLAERLVKHVLINSDYSANAVLSNNLRHGVIEPRILRAIDDAYHLQDAYNADSLKLKISEAVRRYMNLWLTIAEDGPTVSDMIAGCREILKNLIVGGSEIDEYVVASKVIAKISQALKATIHQSCIVFEHQCKSEIRGIVIGHFNNTENTVDLQDRVNTSLERAFVEVGSWLAIADLRSTMDSFSMEDIARFEVDFFITDPSTRKSTEIIVQSWSPKDQGLARKDIILDIEYFEAIYTIIHNLVSNATKYSGLKHRTPLYLRIRASSDNLTFYLRNVVSSHFSEQNYKFHRERALAASKSDAFLKRNDTFKEGGTGFKKIRRICARDFQSATINIPPPSRNGKMFIVEVKIPFVTGESL